jgi:hypothetical protein
VKCDSCGGESFSPRVAVVVVVCELLPNGHYCLLPEADYRLCEEDECGAGHSFAQRAIDAHATAREASNRWKTAVIVFVDGSGWTLRCNRPEVVRA